jgi:tRNA dimethylallyltransferase
MKQENTIIIIVGPTASGKTSLSLQLAQYLNTNIISADSRQCFKELNIGVAKPANEELERVKHYFINSHSIFENITAQTFEQCALKAAEEIFKHNKYAVMAGGTGLYIKAFCEGLDEIPDVDEIIRKEIIEEYNNKGLLWLQNEVKKKDPLFWQAGEQQNPQRLMRALEVFLSSGKSITTFRTQVKKERSFNIIKVGLDISKEQLHSNIDTRIDEMIENGLVNEVESLWTYKNLNALQTVGYKEIFEYFEGSISLKDAIKKIKANTNQYAKRQMTWFKKDKSIYWIKAAQLPLLMSFVK